MKPILVLEHNDFVPPGYLGEVFEEDGIPFEVVRLHEGAPVPIPDGYSAIVSLGGLMGAYDEDAYPYLADEKRLLKMAVDDGMPVLGICLGCQMLADALGGDAYLAPEMEVMFDAVTTTPAGADDPVGSHLIGPMLIWHQDTWTPPPGATVLAETADYPQAFRLGSAVGIQPHPEADAAIVAAWIAEPEGRSQLEGAGIDAEALLARVRDASAESEAAAKALFRRWLDGIT